MEGWIEFHTGIRPTLGIEKRQAIDLTQKYFLDCEKRLVLYDRKEVNRVDDLKDVLKAVLAMIIFEIIKTVASILSGRKDE